MLIDLDSDILALCFCPFLHQSPSLLFLTLSFFAILVTMRLLVLLQRNDKLTWVYITFCEQDLLIVFLNEADVCAQATHFWVGQKLGAHPPTQNMFCKISSLVLRRLAINTTLILLPVIWKFSAAAIYSVLYFHLRKYIMAEFVWYLAVHSANHLC